MSGKFRAESGGKTERLGSRKMAKIVEAGEEKSGELGRFVRREVLEIEMR